MTGRRAANASLVIALLVLGWSASSASPLPGWPDSHSSAYLGVHIEAVTPEQANALKLSSTTGAVVTLVDQDGPACHAGLKDRDVIVGFNGAKVDSPEQLGSLIRAAAPGQTVSLTVVRAGQNKDIKVALGSWPRVPPHAQSFASSVPPMAFAGPMMAAPAIPDVPEVPAFTVLSSRHGLVVEPLSSQMADFFGVQRGRGVLVRSVEKGSPADAAGLKACDVILKINNDPVHDMADWGRSMRVRGGKVSVVILREKREQTLVISLPAPNTSKLDGFDQTGFEQQMEALGREMEALRPELEAQTRELAQLDAKEIERVQRELQKSMQSEKGFALMQKEMARSMPSQQELEQMQRNVQESLKNLPSAVDMDKIRAQVQDSLKNLPSQQDMEKIRHDVEASMQDLTPKLQQQMEELRKQMEQHKLDLRQMMKGMDDDNNF